MGATGELIENRVFDELTPGLRAALRRVISMEDIQAFALVSGDINPAHVDTVYADASRFHGVIAHGMFAGALISSLLGTEFPGPGTIYIGQSLHFHRPVRLADALLVEVVVIDCDAETKNVRLDCTVQNQHGELVVSGEALVRAPTHKLALPRVALPQLHLFDPEARLQHWLASLDVRTALRCAVVHPCDEESLRGALDAGRRGLIVPVLVGPVEKIQACAERAGVSLQGVELHDAAHSHAAAQAAAAMAAAGEVAMLMKGSLHTDELISAVLAEPALRTGRRLSHVFRFEVPTYAKPVLVTDAAINIRPSLEDKADIARNAIALAHALGVAQPRLAILSAVETVTPRLVSTLDAAALCKMADRGQIQGALLDGPLAFDNAISAEAATVKGIQSPVAGQADILLVPDLESGNMLAKQLEYLAGAASCGVVLGAKIPIALTSRADNALSRAASAALARLMAEEQP
ncbi:bifunctional enoyl-CoA hydratase/phosphate acetyltransferase [Paucibacter sp. APW11]|uniref:Bifunctional enoyl-CoA hydratase/phosphate acetyltransferase n=1 Tax=Roseateles aquae TaxID=3077235 RepID=A0ABU3PEP4_9BURK|nr:bifunctional enoyl-CoA hydratase/phosphate acetyltransferase [Paucibacter sp. APW11]MDT9001075.1 bifunctional enoyl-CoA hydratase/phosphate acetyltransferase [Paucibacter sp. APW11]